MDKLLIICGLWIIISQLLFCNRYIKNNCLFYRGMQFIGAVLCIIGALYCFGIRQNIVMLELVVFCFFFLLMCKSMYDNYGFFKKYVWIVVPALMIISLIVIVLDYMEIASAIIILTGSFIYYSVLTAYYERRLD